MTTGWSCSVVSKHVMNLCGRCDPISQPKMNIPYQTTTLNCLPFDAMLCLENKFWSTPNSEIPTILPLL